MSELSHEDQASFARVVTLSGVERLKTIYDKQQASKETADPMNVGESVNLAPSRVSSEDVPGGGANAPQVSISAGNQHHHSLHASDAL